jgi:uncharacterized SAM-binding protein YcdF (DUF218 family)
MKNVLFVLKCQVNILSILMLVFLTACLLVKLKKRRAAIIILITDIILFLIASTGYLPQHLAKQLESQYLPFDPHTLQDKERVYIHLLGSGYSLDGKLPATARLGLAAQGRLSEAIRIFRELENSTLITSGGSFHGLETQAAVAKSAAVLLGVDSNRVITLNTATTTAEEVAGVKKMIGKDAVVIVVTDAIHMPRAMSFFHKQGFMPIAAPTNFRVYENKHDISLKWWPAITNMALTDAVLHEYLGSLKAAL